jgi:protein-tyrosine kinase
VNLISFVSDEQDNSPLQKVRSVSKNFELLREAGWRQELFEGLPCSSEEPREPAPPVSSQTAQPEHLPLQNDQVSMLVRKIFLDSPNHSVIFFAMEKGASCTWACAQAGKALAGATTGKVCVVDANFTAPALHEQFAKFAPSGLADAVFAAKPAKEFAELAGGQNKNLWVLTAGSEEKRDLALQNKSFLQSPLQELKNDFEYILIDGPALSSDPLLASVGRGVDGAVLVLNSTKFAPNLLLKAKRQMEAVRLPLLGAVLTQSKEELPSLLHRLIK